MRWGIALSGRWVEAMTCLLPLRMGTPDRSSEPALCDALYHAPIAGRVRCCIDQQAGDVRCKIVRVPLVTSGHGLSVAGQEVIGKVLYTLLEHLAFVFGLQ